MSDALSFAVVTATLQSIVQQAVGDAVPGATVRVGPPRVPPPSAGPEASLYLYLVSPNEYLRNGDLPRTVHRPALAVDLHYVITFFGEQDLATERMAASVASHIHAQPALTPQLIRAATQAGGPYGYLSGSNLADTLGPVELHPYYLSLEELTKFWTVFFQMAHRLSLQYIVGPIVVDGGPSPAPIPPPRKRHFDVRHGPVGKDES